MDPNTKHSVTTLVGLAATVLVGCQPSPSPVHADRILSKTAAPLIIGHRGSPGLYPEHTARSYREAVLAGADFIEPDLVVSKDGVLVVRHENALALLNADGTLNDTETTTDVYLRPDFSDRLTSKVIDGKQLRGWFAEDFTVAELKSLNALQRTPTRDKSFDGAGLRVMTFGEVLDLARQLEIEVGRPIGVYPETKHPTFFRAEGRRINGELIDTDTSALLIATLIEHGFTSSDRVFIQSFETENLQRLKFEIMPRVGLDLPLVQLIGQATQRPYDLQRKGDARTFSDLITPTELAKIGLYATGIGPNKRLVLPLAGIDQNGDGVEDDISGDGKISDADRFVGSPTKLVAHAHAVGLLVHVYTVADDIRSASFAQDPVAEYEALRAAGVDGFFTDYPATAARFRSPPNTPTR